MTSHETVRRKRSSDLQSPQQFGVTDSPWATMFVVLRQAAWWRSPAGRVEQVLRVMIVPRS